MRDDSVTGLVQVSRALINTVRTPIAKAIWGNTLNILSILGLIFCCRPGLLLFLARPDLSSHTGTCTILNISNETMRMVSQS